MDATTACLIFNWKSKNTSILFAIGENPYNFVFVTYLF
jgi:hypothetical protein